MPLGYELKDGKLYIVEEEAEQIRMIFRRYLELGSVNRLVIDLRERNFRTKVRKLSNGQKRGGVLFTQGPLFYMLRNRFYIGEVVYKGEVCPGSQPPLIECSLFEAVQQRLTEQRAHNVTARTKNDAPLRGILFDEAGHPMIPTHTTKQGVRYRYYVSEPYLRGHAKPPLGLTVRVPATEIEAAVINAIEAHHLHLGLKPDRQPRPGSLPEQIVRIDVRKNALAVWLKGAEVDEADGDTSHRAVDEQTASLLIPWTKPPSKRFKEILVPDSVERRHLRPIKFERRAALLKSIAGGRAWLEEIVFGSATVEEIASRQKCSGRHVNMTISMAFIAPGLVRAAVEGRLPRGIGVANLRESPAEWSLQYQRLGLAPE